MKRFQRSEAHETSAATEIGFRRARGLPTRERFNRVIRLKEMNITESSERATFVPMRAWASRHTAGFITRRDPRELLVIEHPWMPSVKGGFGEWRVRTCAPAGWQPGAPLFVSFYQFDNYSGTRLEDEWGTGTQAFNGHRFKQLLVNGRLVWEADVADEAFSVTPEGWRTGARSDYLDSYRVVKITGCAQRDLALTFRVLDKVASTTHLPGDVYKRFAWSAGDPNEARKNFLTVVWFGDVSVHRNREIVRPH